MCLNSLVQIARNAASPSDSTLSAKKGWYLGLNSSEQVVTSATTLYDSCERAFVEVTVPEITAVLASKLRPSGNPEVIAAQV